ncbi:ImmA/IrrE family metallo-endopeptidase [Streptomyces sp. NPDC101175]|uniref:ImmA/IrrE family metallo-endopeptidase n=1 Tax=Streptomyces sp. NPDC101175 TaxID=3366123 RepID=UPI0038389076
MSRADAAARTITDQTGPALGPVDVEVVAANLGLVVVRQVADASVDGMLIRRDGQVVIGLNDGRPVESQRLTLAHLIGHHQIHARRDLILDGIVRHVHSRLACIPTDREEMEANRFAMALLMPEGAVRRMAREADFRHSRATGGPAGAALRGEPGRDGRPADGARDHPRRVITPP